MLLDAMQGPPRVSSVLPDEVYNESGGYPANVYEQLSWVAPRKLLLDNALQHLAKSVQSVLHLVYGTMPFLGKPHTPKTRGDQESEFRSLATRIMHQLPESKGSHPKDPIREGSKRGLLGRIEVAALENVLDAYFHNANGLPKATAGHISPLERLGRVIQKNQLGNVVSIAQSKRNPCFFSEPVIRPVKLSRNKKHVRPAHVNFDVRYSSEKLRQNAAAMEGQKLVLRPDYKNLQTVLAFSQSGGLYGELRAEGVWGKFPHDLRIRKLYMKFRQRGLLGPRADDAPMESLYQYLCEGAQADKKIATNRAYFANYLSQHIAELSLTQFDILTAVRKADELAANELAHCRGPKTDEFPVSIDSTLDEAIPDVAKVSAIQGTTAPTTAPALRSVAADPQNHAQRASWLPAVGPQLGLPAPRRSLPVVQRSSAQPTSGIKVVDVLARMELPNRKGTTR